MPLGRYLVFTTCLLLALVFLTNLYVPEIPAESLRTDVDRSIIRIHSEHKWPDAIVIDTNLPTITPPQAVLSETQIGPRARGSFAQIPKAAPGYASLQPESRRTGSTRPAKRMRAGVRRVASYQNSRIVPEG
jgi:hypothetical protein